MSVEHVPHRMWVEFLGASSENPEQNDLIGVNAARASFDKHKDTFTDTDRGLLRFLIRAKPVPHTAPLRHATVSFRIHMPITVDRQFATHHIGVARSSASYRYVKADDYYEPYVFYKQDKDAKQGSSNESFANGDRMLLATLWNKACMQSFEVYQTLLDLGLCRDQARMVLPQAQMTTVVVTMSLWAFWNFFTQRYDDHAQKEIQWIAYQMVVHVNDMLPETVSALLRYGPHRTWKQRLAVWLDDTYRQGWKQRVLHKTLGWWIAKYTPTFDQLECVEI